MERRNLIVYGDGPSGMRLGGGGHFPIYVSKLHKKGRARYAGLMIGDEILSINGFQCNRLTLQEAQDLVTNTSDIHLDLLRRPGNSHYAFLQTQDGFDTDSSEISPLGHRSFVKSSIKSPISFRTTNSTLNTTTIPIIVSDADRETGGQNTNSFLSNDVSHGRQGHSWLPWQQQTSNHSSVSRLGFNWSQDSARIPDLREKHITRAFIVPESSKNEQKPWHLFHTQVDPIDMRYDKQIPTKHVVHSFEEIHHKPKPEVNVPINVWQPPKLFSNKIENERENEQFVRHSPFSSREEVVIWSSKQIETPKQKEPPKQDQPPAWKPQLKPKLVPEVKSFRSSPPKIAPPQLPSPARQQPPPLPPPLPPHPSMGVSDFQHVVVNEDLIDAGLLTRGFVTAAGIPVEMHLEKKKLYADSSFYEDPAHKYPTIEEQIKMARRVANLLATPVPGKAGKGQRMFLKRQEMSSRWITELDPLVEMAIQNEKKGKQVFSDSFTFKGHIGEGPFDQLSRAKRASALEKMRLKEEKSLHNVVPFDLCSQLAHELHQQKGKGGKLFAKIKERAEHWVVSENQPPVLGNPGAKPYNQELRGQKEPIEFTPLKPLQPFTPLVQTNNTGPRLMVEKQQTRNQQRQPAEEAHPVSNQMPRNRLKDMINIPRPALTPWDSVVETGDLEKAFEHLNEYEAFNNALSVAPSLGTDFGKHNFGSVPTFPSGGGLSNDQKNHNVFYQSQGGGYNSTVSQSNFRSKFRPMPFQPR